MKVLSLLFLFLSLAESTLLYGFKWMNFTFNSSTEADSYETSRTYRFCLPTGLQLDSKGQVYISIPRIDPSVPATFALLTESDSQLLLSPFPTWWANTQSNPSSFQSITVFEIDLDDNFWLVDQGSMTFLHLDPAGEILSTYDLSAATTASSKLTDLTIDLDRGFAYISDSGTPGILVLNLNTNEVRMLLQKHYSTIPDPSYLLTVNGSRVYSQKGYQAGVSGIALSCDKRDLYYSPVTSRELYAISTQYLRNSSQSNYSDYVQNLGFKNTASQGISISEKGNMYLSDLVNSNVFYYGQMMPYPQYFLVYFLSPIMNDSNVLWPYTITFNNVKRTMIVLANQVQNFNIEMVDFENPVYGEFNFYVFEVDVDDRSYLYGCQDVVSIKSSIEIPVWIYALISILTLIVITIGICAVKHYRMIKKRHGTLIYN